MKFSILVTAMIAFITTASTAHATERMTCEAGDSKSWNPQTQLIDKITSEGWQVHRVKVDGRC